MAKILYFGRLTDEIGTHTETRSLPEHIRATDTLRKWLDEAHAAGSALLDETIRIAINNELVTEPASVSDTDEIAFMPPVGGG